MDWITNIVAPIVVALVVGLIGWFLRQYFDSVKRERERLQDERRNIYMQILEPYIWLFTSVGNQDTRAEEALKQLKSFDYRKTSFELKLMGSDKVVLMLNSLMQHFYTRDSHQNNNEPDHTGIFLLGKFFLAIRRDLIKNTKLDHIDMLRDFIKDIDKYLESNKQYRND